MILRKIASSGGDCGAFKHFIMWVGRNFVIGWKKWTMGVVSGLTQSWGTSSGEKLIG